MPIVISILFAIVGCHAATIANELGPRLDITIKQAAS